LHFAAPNIFPIWDSKIANYFDSQPTAADDYYAYCEALHLYLPKAKWPDSFPDQIECFWGDSTPQAGILLVQKSFRLKK
jgi:hypothetical protein